MARKTPTSRPAKSNPIERVLIIHESVRESLMRDVGTFATVAGWWGLGYATGSSALEWAGMGLGFVFVFRFAKKALGSDDISFTPDEARAYLDKRWPADPPRPPKATCGPETDSTHVEPTEVSLVRFPARMGGKSPFTVTKDKPEAKPEPAIVRDRDDAIAGLFNLGYSKKEATAAVDRILTMVRENHIDIPDVSTLLRAALRELQPKT